MDKDDDKSKFDELKDEAKQEAHLFAGRTKLGAQGLMDDFKDKVVSMAEKVGSDPSDEPVNYGEVLESEAERAYRLQVRLGEFIDHAKPVTDTYSSQRFDMLRETMERHKTELKGEYGKLNPNFAHHEEGFRDKISGLAGALEGATARPEFEWSTIRDLLDQLREISDVYMTIHGLGLATERTLAAGRTSC